MLAIPKLDVSNFEYFFLYKYNPETEGVTDDDTYRDRYNNSGVRAWMLVAGKLLVYDILTMEAANS